MGPFLLCILARTGRNRSIHALALAVGILRLSASDQLCHRFDLSVQGSIIGLNRNIPGYSDAGALGTAKGRVRQHFPAGFGVARSRRPHV